MKLKYAKGFTEIFKVITESGVDTELFYSTDDGDYYTCDLRIMNMMQITMKTANAKSLFSKNLKTAYIKALVMKKITHIFFYFKPICNLSITVISLQFF